MGKTGESVNTTHQTKKLDIDDLLYYRDRFDVPLTDEQVRNIEYYKPDEKSTEIKYLKEKDFNLVDLFQRELHLQNLLKLHQKIFLII